MLTTYRRVLSLPGAMAFSGSGLVGRLPISMVSLGLVLLVSARTGSYAMAGAVSASYLIANAATASTQGRIADRLGQSRVLPLTVLVFGAALAATMVAVDAGWPAPVPHLLAAVSGAALPQVGSCVRARWSAVVPDRRDLQTAFALEAVVDESVFMVGPTLVTFLSTGIDPVAGLAAAIVCGVGGTLALAAQRRTEPTAHRGRRRSTAHAPMGWPVLGPLVVCMVCMGVLFGAAEVVTVAFTSELGVRSAAGPLLAVWALGSLLSGAANGALRATATPARRFRWGLLALGVLLVPLPFEHGVVLLGASLFLAGFAISPTLIAAVSWVEQTVPPSRLTEGLAIVTTGIAAGVAPGAALAGRVVDAYGASPAYWVCAGAGLVGAAVAFSVALREQRRVVGSPGPSGSSG
ncbi:MAG TPA: MFS transporter [Nocardioidaceae bacterium]|nr:MFS transporter [Nocardioidaceae bacterium]